MKCILEQSVWFDGIDFNKNDFPVETPVFIESIDNQSSLFDDYNLFDCAYGTNRYVMLSELFDANTETKWAIIKEKASHCKSVTLVSDISFQNPELSFVKQFYISVFYSALKKVNSNCFVYESNK